MTLEEFQQESLKRKVGRKKRGKPAPYSPAARRFAVNFAARQLSSGQSMWKTARSLGVSVQSLNQWKEMSGGKEGFQPVEIRDVAASSVASAALITPRGFRVEGLDFETLKLLLREL